MNQSDEVMPNPKAIALITNITQLMDEVDQVLQNPTSSLAENQIAAPLREPSSDVPSKIYDSARRTDRALRAHPYLSLVLALGTGALLGVLCARRS